MCYGLHAADAYCVMHPKKKGIVNICQQGMEAKIGLAKKCQIEHGQGNKINIGLMTKYIDMFVLGGLKYDQHDLRVMSHQHSRLKLLLYNHDLTEDLYYELENDLPVASMNYLDLLDNIEFNKLDTISSELFEIFHSNIIWKNKCNLISIDINVNLIKELIDENENVELYKASFNESRSRGRRSKKNICKDLKLLQQSTQKNFNIIQQYEEEDDNDNDNDSEDDDDDDDDDDNNNA